jgi:hypothetical protein
MSLSSNRSFSLDSLLTDGAIDGLFAMPIKFWPSEKYRGEKAGKHETTEPK